MDNIINDIKSTVNSAVKKSGDLLELGKVKLSLSENNTHLYDLYQKLGEMAYRANREEEEDLASEMESVVWEIDAALSEIKKLNDKLAELRSQKLCPQCGKENVVEAQYCNACGSKFDDTQEQE